VTVTDSFNGLSRIFTDRDAERAALGLDVRARKRGSRWRTSCPLCGKRRRLSIGADGIGPGIKCFSGCDSVAILRELVRRGLLPDWSRRSTTDLAPIRQAIARECWLGTAGSIDYRVIWSMINLAEHLCRIELAAAVRDVALWAHVSTDTASTSLRRLAHKGFLKLVTPASVAHAAVYRLCVPEKTRGAGDSVLELHRGRAVTRSAAGFNHDVFRCRAVGPVRGRIYGLLVEPRSARVLRDWMGYRDARPVRGHLAKMMRLRLARRRDDGLYERGDADLDVLAVRLGVAGATGRQRTRIAAERILWRTTCDGFEQWMKLGELVDPETGELLAADYRPRKRATLREFRRAVLLYRTRNAENRVHEGGAQGSPDVVAPAGSSDSRLSDLEREIAGDDVSRINRVQIVGVKGWSTCRNMTDGY
jgi:hypothetical protein